jgi:hypothetical protein
MKRALIFLDIDGVLNTVQEVILKNRNEKKLVYRLKYGIGRIVYKIFQKIIPSSCETWYYRFYYPWFTEHHSFNIYACSNLLYILEKTDAYIVVSSTWRHSGLKNMKILLKQNGIPEDRVIGITTFKGIPCDCSEEKKKDIQYRCSRGHQIEEYLKKNPCDNFIILDDDADMGRLSNRLVQTNSYNGLLITEADKAISMLNEEPIKFNLRLI